MHIVEVKRGNGTTAEEIQIQERPDSVPRDLSWCWSDKERNRATNKDRDMKRQN